MIFHEFLGFKSKSGWDLDDCLYNAQKEEIDFFSSPPPPETKMSFA